MGNIDAKLEEAKLNARSQELKAQQKTIINNYYDDRDSVSEVKVKIDDNGEARGENSEVKDGVIEEIEKIRREEEAKDRIEAQACDFSCTVFYIMVGLLIFTTMSKTVTHYTGGTCGSVYAIQPLLAYGCVGLAFTIIRRLRKKLKKQVIPGITDNPSSETKAKTNGEGYQTFTAPPTPVMEKPIFNLDYDKNLDSNEELVNVISNKPLQPISDEKKFGSILPLPELPPPKSGPKRNDLSGECVEFKANELSVDSLILDYNYDEPNRNKYAVKSNVNNLNGISCHNGVDLSGNYSPTMDAKTYWNTYDFNSYNSKY